MQIVYYLFDVFVLSCRTKKEKQEGNTLRDVTIVELILNN